MKSTYRPPINSEGLRTFVYNCCKASVSILANRLGYKFSLKQLMDILDNGYVDTIKEERVLFQALTGDDDALDFNLNPLLFVSGPCHDYAMTDQGVILRIKGKKDYDGFMTTDNRVIPYSEVLAVWDRRRG